MKVLCPVDFSSDAIHACEWIANLLNGLEDSEMHLCHFIHYSRRASMFISMDQILVDQAEKDMVRLMKSIESKFPNILLTKSLYKTAPKEGIVRIAQKGDYDLIVTGTTGLNRLKNMTIGSVTEYIFEHSAVPVLAIPESTLKIKASKFLLAVDDQVIRNMSAYIFVRDFCKLIGSDLHIAHVIEKGNATFDYDPGIDMIMRDLDSHYVRLDLKDSVAKTLQNYCLDQDVDVLCLIHHYKNWLQKLFYKSTVTSGLFDVRLPLLVLNELENNS